MNRSHVRIGFARIIALFSALLLIAVFLAGTLSGRFRGWVAGKPAVPRIAVDPPRHDFGRVKPGQIMEVDFTIENQGGRTLILESPTASCGCQKPSLDRSSVEPGERATLHVRQEAQDKPGAFNHAIFVKSNDPATSDVLVPLWGTVSKGVVVRPDPLYMGVVKLGEKGPGRSRCCPTMAFRFVLRIALAPGLASRSTPRRGCRA